MNWFWRPIYRPDPKVATLIAGQLSLLYNNKAGLEAEITYAAAQAPAWHAWVPDATSPTGSISMSRDDYLVEANEALVAINDQIAALEA